MLDSVLNSQVRYSIDKKIENDDIDLEVSVYKVKIFDIEVATVIGNIKREFVNYGILYAPVYIIINKKVIEKIGYFEFYTDTMSAFYDKEGDLDISVMEGPLVFDYVDSDYLLNLVKKSNFLNEFELLEQKYLSGLSEKVGVSKQEVKQAERIISDSKKNVVVDNIEAVENINKILTSNETKFIKKLNKISLVRYKKQKNSSIVQQDSSWIQKYYNNNKFGIIDNEGNGDCLFATIRDGLENLNIILNVASLRHLQAKNITEEQFNTYKTLFQSFINEITNGKAELQQLKNEIEVNSKKYKDTISTMKNLMKEGKRSEVSELNTQNVNLKKRIESQKKEFKLKKKLYNNSIKNLNEFKFMKNIETLEQLQTFMKTSNFWADSATISRLELLLNIKIIILSEEDWFNDNHSKIMRCGDMVNETIESRGYFKPKYYLIVSYTGNHYKLITYNSKKIFTFYELPYPIKEEIVENCFNNKGKNLYQYIPEFVGFNNEIINVFTVVNEINKIKKMNISNEELAGQLSILNEKIRQHQDTMTDDKLLKINKIIQKEFSQPNETEPMGETKTAKQSTSN